MSLTVADFTKQHEHEDATQRKKSHMAHASGKCTAHMMLCSTVQWYSTIPYVRLTVARCVCSVELRRYRYSTDHHERNQMWLGDLR